MTGIISVPLQSLVYSVKRTGAKTVSCGAPVEVQSWDERTDWKRTDRALFSKKCTIQSVVNLGSTFRQGSVSAKRWGCIVLKAEEKLTKNTRIKDPGLSKCIKAL